MSLTPMNQVELGYSAPEFSLLDTLSGEYKEFVHVKGELGTVVMFICNHCPFVIHVQEELVHIAQDYLSKGIGFVAVSSNDVMSYPQDGPAEMKKTGDKWQFSFPYLYDETQEVAKAYFAACTPDFSVFNSDNKCVYRGQLDSSRPGNGIEVTGEDLRQVCEALLQRIDISSENQTPSVGCNIKWK